MEPWSPERGPVESRNAAQTIRFSTSTSDNTTDQERSGWDVECDVMRWTAVLVLVPAKHQQYSPLEPNRQIRRAYLEVVPPALRYYFGTVWYYPPASQAGLVFLPSFSLLSSTSNSSVSIAFVESVPSSYQAAVELPSAVATTRRQMIQ